MANEFLTTKNIARQALPRLIENLLLPNLCYKDYSNDFAMQGDTIRVRKPVILEAKDFTAGTAVTAQDVKETSVDVTLNKLASVDINFEAIQMATSVDDLNRLAIEPAAVALAQKINADGFALYADIPTCLGTAGTTPDGLDDFSNIRKFLNKAKAPLTDRVALWDAEADAKFTELGNLVKVNESGDSKALREGEIGRVFGLDNYMSQAVKTHTGGSAAGTLKVDGAVTAGATMIHIDGASSATATVKAGDGLKVGDYYFVCTEDVTFASNEGDVKVSPAVPVNIADNTDVTVYQTGTQNLAFHKNAIAFVTRPLIAPSGVDSYTTSYNGISLRVVRGYDMDYKREKLSIDVLYGYKVVYPELACRYLG